MSAPTFVAAYNSDWTTVAPSPFYGKSVSVTTQAGDLVIVYAAAESTSLLLGTPQGNSISFTVVEDLFAANFCPMKVWAGTDATGGTSWTLEAFGDSDFYQWGFGCAVFRASTGIGASDQTTAAGSTGALGLTTTAANSAVLAFQADFFAANGASRTWRTVNSITPTSGNGLETTYSFSSGVYTTYAAYYNDVGSIGANTYGASAPTPQDFSIITVEIKGTSSPPNTAYVSWFQA